MICPVHLTQRSSAEVALMVTAYGTNLDTLLRATLQFLRVAIKDLPTRESQDAGSQGTCSCNFEREFREAMMPHLLLEHEFHRVSALIEASVMQLRASRLVVETMRHRKGGGTSVRQFGDYRAIANYVYPTSEISADTCFLRSHELEILARLRSVKEANVPNTTVREARIHPLLFFPLPDGNALDLNQPGENVPQQRGLAITRSDIHTWFHILQHFGFVPRDILLGEHVKPDQARVIRAGFSAMLTQAMETVCFAISNYQLLGRHDYREDLFALLEHSRRLSAAMEEALLQAEALLHQVNGYSAVLGDTLLVLASGVDAGEEVFHRFNAKDPEAPGTRSNQYPSIHGVRKMAGSSIADFEVQ